MRSSVSSLSSFAGTFLKLKAKRNCWMLQNSKISCPFFFFGQAAHPRKHGPPRTAEGAPAARAPSRPWPGATWREMVETLSSHSRKCCRFHVLYTVDHSNYTLNCTWGFDILCFIRSAVWCCHSIPSCLLNG